MKRKLLSILMVASLLAAVASCTPADNDNANNGNNTGGSELVYTSGGEPAALSYGSAQEMLADMQYMAGDGGLELYFNDTNACIGVRTSAGDIFFSNPFDADEAGRSGDVLSRLKSQVTVSYYTPKNEYATMFSFSNCVENGQFSAKQLSNGLEISYHIGDDVDNDIIPVCLPKKSMEAVKAKLTQEQTELLNIYYSEVRRDQIPLEISDAELMTEDGHEFASQVYVLGELQETMREQLIELFKGAGYTQAQKTEDFNACGITVPGENLPFFDITLQYIIEDGKLKVLMPSSAIHSNPTYKIERINVLPMFAASTQKTDPNGYLFIPDGSGAIVSFHDATPNRPATFSNMIYTYDMSVKPDNYDSSQNYFLPVFGTKSGKTSVVGIVEDGQGMAGITAGIGGVVDPYYSVYPYFTLAAKDTITLSESSGQLSGGAQLIKFDENNTYSGDYSVVYHFLAGDNANYVGMARLYQNYLKEQGAASKTRDSIQLVLQTIGTVNTPTTVLGIPTSKMEKYTSFEDAQAMIEYLQSKGVADIDLYLEGWRKNGLDYTVSSKFDPSSVLGGKSGFTDLLAFCTNQKVGLYPIADISVAYRDKWFDGFSTGSDAAKKIDGSYSTLTAFQKDTRNYRAVAYAISHDKYDQYAASFIKSYAKTKAKQISFGNIGTYLSGNYKKNGLNRAQAVTYTTDLLKKFSGDYEIAVSGANAYCIPYITNAYDLPLSSTQSTGETYDIPFLQMVLDGIVNYSATPGNYAQNYQKYLLNCIESKSSPAFVAAAENTDKLRTTKHNYLYNVNFYASADKNIDAYLYVKEALDGVMEEPLTRHERTGEVVYMQYGNGTEIYINYGSSNAELNGVSIPAMSYVKQS